VSAAAGAQDSAAFLEAARRGSAPFRERAAAVRAGYRPVGPESPAMGQHWVHPGLLLAERIDPGRPAILSYATVAGTPQLVGVAYVLPAGAAVPDGPAPRPAWHVHDGTIMAEAVQPDHDAHAAGDAVPAGVAVLHVWIYAENPAGRFASDNWALPFVTAGLDPPATAAPAAARGLSLGRSAAFYAEQQGGHRTALEANGAVVRRWLASRTAGPVTATELAWLERVWSEAAAGREGPTPPAPNWRY
jgi:hypothetical protein